MRVCVGLSFTEPVAPAEVLHTNGVNAPLIVKSVPALQLEGLEREHARATGANKWKREQHSSFQRAHDVTAAWRHDILLVQARLAEPVALRR